MAYHRMAVDPGPDCIEAWLGKFYGDTSDLCVTPLDIYCPDVDAMCDEDKRSLEALRSGNQSELHAYMKFSAMRWLAGVSEYADTIASEVICYTPIETLCASVRCTDVGGRPFEIDKPQVLYDNAENFPLSYGLSLRLDLHAFDIALEVGGTQPFNLLTPMLDCLVDKSVWMPYPKHVNAQTFRHGPGGLGAVRAYEIRFRE